MAMWWRSAVEAQGDVAAGVDAVVTDPVVGVVACGRRGRLWVAGW